MSKTTAKQAAARIRYALFMDQQDVAREIYDRYVDSASSWHAMTCRMGKLRKLGVDVFGAEIRDWNREPWGARKGEE